MKKKLSVLLAMALMISVFGVSGSALATEIETPSDGLGSSVLTVKYNGETVDFPDAQPFIDENDRTLIPVRFVAETMGAEVSWDQDAQTAIVEQYGIRILVPIGSDTISVTRDGDTDTIQMDTAAIIREDRTHIPIRFVAEALGAWVSYSNLFTTVQIYRDVLTPEEINRLHGYYDMTWEEALASVGEGNHGTTDTDWERSYPEIVHFVGAYGFENANEWKLRNPNGIDVLKYPAKKPIDYVGRISGLTYTYGTQPDLDFAKLILAEARGVEQEMNAAGKVTLSLKTDLSCVYASRHSNDAATYVRGVVTVSIPKNADIAWIRQNYDFIVVPKAGETREIDVEIRVNTFTANVYWSEMTAPHKEEST